MENTRKTTSISYVLLAVAVMVTVLFGTSPTAHGQFIPDAANKQIDSLEFKDANVLDAVRILAELSGVNIFATREAGTKKISLFVRNTSVHNAIDGVARVGGLWYRYNRKTKAYLLMTAEQYRDDLVVYREDFTRVFTMRHQNVVNTAVIIESLFGDDRVDLNLDTDNETLLDSFEDSGLNGGSFGSQSSSSRTRDGSISGRNTSSSRNRRFDSSSRRNRFGRSTGGRRGGSADRRGVEIIDDDIDLSTEKLASLRALPDGTLPNVSASEIQRLENREPPIFVTVNRQHNLLYVRTSDEQAMNQIARIVNESDRPTPQVLLEMKVLEVSVGDGFRSVFNFDYLSKNTTTLAGAEGQAITVPEVALGLGNFPLQGGTLLFSLIDERIRATVELLEKEDKIKVLATPMVLAANNTPAQLFIGDEVVVRTGAEADTTVGTTGATNTVIEIETEIRDVGDTLRIVPRINSDRTVSLLVQQDNSSLKSEDRSIPVATDEGQVINIPIDTISTANIEGVVMAKDGFTVAIGGLIRTADRKNLEKVPVLGDVPVVGRLFRREDLEETKTELVLLITPHVFFTPAEAENQSRATLARLSSNPEMERYGFGASRRTAALDSARSMEDFITLTRFAAQTIRGKTDPKAGIFPAFFTDDPLTDLVPGSALTAQPVASWQKGGLFVTAVRFENPGDNAVPLGPGNLKGEWLAATFERDLLPASSSEGAANLGYLISDRPFDDVIKRMRQAYSGSVGSAGTSGKATP